MPNWLKLAMEQDQHSGQSSAAAAYKSASHRPSHFSPINSPDSLMTTSNDASPLSPRTPQLNVTIPQSRNLISDVQNNTNTTKPDLDNNDDDQRYWEEEDEGYWGEMEEAEQDEDLEEAYRSVL